VRSVESVALDILRSIEDRLITDGVVPLVATTAVDVALYILNQKRAHLNDIQQRYRVPITVTADENMHVSQFVIERGAEGAVIGGESSVVHMDWAHHREEPHEEVEREDARTEEPRETAETEGDQTRRRSRRRRRKRHGEGAEGQRVPAAKAAGDSDEEPVAERASESAPRREARAEEGADGRKGPRRRGRRGGRRGRSAQRSDRAPGEQTREETGERQNGGREERVSAEPAAPEEDFVREREERPAPRGEPAFSEAPPAREPEPVGASAESEESAEPSPRRRGWWSRG
jgi:ribonuclease E